MAKIMLVEDDNNLREIYEARLLAEGYEIVSAEDGEQALALAVKEKPDLIISDVMMPKISGFDMLDILRSTPETRHTKVIMMTALSQAEDKARADKLGADRYLVKSQVTLEEVAKAAQEVLQDDDTVPAAAVTNAAPSDPAPTPQAAEPPQPAAPSPAPVAANPAPATAPASSDDAAPAIPVATPAPTSDDAASSNPTSDAAPAGQATSMSDPGGSSPTDPPKASTSPTPTADPSSVPEEAQSAASEAATVEQQINEFAKNLPANQPAPPQPSADSTNAAAATAANMAEAANAVLQNTPPAPASEPTPAPASPMDGVELAQPSDSHIAGKKVIAPINDLTASKGPDLDALLAKEGGAEPPAVVPAPPQSDDTEPTTITPDNGQVEVKPPGNVIAPNDPNHPNNIAL